MTTKAMLGSVIDCRVMRIFDGTSEIHRGIIAKGLMQKGSGLT